MYQGYGQTEILPVAMMAPRRWAASHCAPAPFAQLQIWDEDNNPVQPARRARSSPSARRRPRIIDGWMKTARLDADGSLYMVDRADDVGRDRRRRKMGECASRPKRQSRRNNWSTSARFTERSGARNFASRSGLDESAGSRATEGVRARLRE
jgi:hypothetical protein